MSFYEIPAPGRGLVRTGLGGPVVKFADDSGVIVIPMLHKIESVSVETVHVKSSLRSPEGVVCKCGRQINVDTVFEVRINPTKEDVLKVLTLHGAKASDKEYVVELLRPKFVQAVRAVLNQYDANAVLENYETIMEEVFMSIGRDLNGYVLEDGSLNITGTQEKAEQDGSAPDGTDQ